MRLVAAAVIGAAIAVASAVVLGDYPLSGAVPWMAAVLVPLLIGCCMAAVARPYRRWLWLATGPVAAASIVWGVRIATGWGLDPTPASAWAAVAIALVWPPVWAAVDARRSAHPASTS